MQISGFQPLTLSDYPGKIAAIVFTSGCNFNCVYCHNRQLLSAQSGFSEKQIFSVLAAQRQFLEGLVITGGEPTVQADLINFIRRVKSQDLCVKLDTNGSMPDVLETLLSEQLLDYIAMDLKAPMADYARITQCEIDSTNLLRSIQLIADSGLPHLFRTTYSEVLLSAEQLCEIEQTLLPAGSLFVRQRIVE